MWKTLERQSSWRSASVLERMLTMIEFFASGRSATASRSLGSRSATMRASPLARISLALATTSPFLGTIASSRSKSRPTKAPDFLLSSTERRAPWMPLSVMMALGVRERQRLVIVLAEIDDGGFERRRRVRGAAPAGAGPLRQAPERRCRGRAAGSSAPRGRRSAEHRPRRPTGEAGKAGVTRGDGQTPHRNRLRSLCVSAARPERMGRPALLLPRHDLVGTTVSQRCSALSMRSAQHGNLFAKLKSRQGCARES